MITMRDIAEKVGTSQATVSYVLNGRHKEMKISEKTRHRILKVAQKMNYRPNELAKYMVTGKSNVIGFMIRGTLNEYTAQIMSGIMREASKNKFHVKLLQINNDDIKSAVESCLSQCLAGIICHAFSEENLNSLYRLLAPFNIPISLLGAAFPGSWGIRILSDDESGVIAITEHLLSLGHRHFAHLTNNVENRAYASLRLNIFRQFLAKNGIELKEENIGQVENSVPELVAPVLEKTLNGTGPRPTALFCSTDYLAALSIRFAKKLGFQVPKTLAIAGFANLHLARYTDPPLTTVEEPYEKMSEKATELLINEIKRDDQASLLREHTERIPVKLIIRESTLEEN